MTSLPKTPFFLATPLFFLLLYAGTSPSLETLSFHGEVLLTFQGEAQPPIPFAVAEESVRLDLGDFSYYLFQQGGVHHVFPDHKFFLLLPQTDVLLENQVRLTRLLSPGAFWESAHGRSVLSGAEEIVQDGQTLLLVTSLDSLWEEKGVRMTYWLDPQRRIPVRRIVERKVNPLPDILQVNLAETPPDESVFEIPDDYTPLHVENLLPSEELPSWVLTHPSNLSLQSVRRLFISTTSSPPSPLAWVLYYQGKEPGRFVGVVWLRTGDHPFAPLLKVLSKPFVQESGLSARPYSSEGWEGRIITNLPFPSVFSWLLPPQPSQPDGLEGDNP